ncbi:hypothetical protein BHM03_00051044 [Ensete ventricosum]|nr:hypothetical protein BHM03_00051044 [Ensete ventricosum]
MPPQDQASVKDANLGDEVTGGESDDAEEIGVDLMLVLVQHSVGGAEAGATRGRRSSGWSISCHWTAKASTEAPDLEIRTRRGSSSGCVGEKLSLDTEERRGYLS